MNIHVRLKKYQIKVQSMCFWISTYRYKYSNESDFEIPLELTYLVILCQIVKLLSDELLLKRKRRNGIYLFSTRFLTSNQNYYCSFLQYKVSFSVFLIFQPKQFVRIKPISNVKCPIKSNDLHAYLIVIITKQHPISHHINSNKLMRLYRLTDFVILC